jgi:beta-glucosidase
MVIQDAGVACVMAAYNKIQIGSGSAQFCSENADLLNTMLRQTFGFKGFVISDWWAMKNGQNCAGASAESPEALAGLTAGLDIEMPWSLNYTQLETLNMPAQITAGAKRIVTQQFRFHSADPGMPIGLQTSQSTFSPANFSVANPAHLDLAYQSAIENMVLLKNDNGTLPIPSSVKTIAVVGAVVPFTLQEADVNTGNINFGTDLRTGDIGSSRTWPDPATSVGPLAGIQAAAAAMPSKITVLSASDPTSIPDADFYVDVAGLTPEDEGEGYTSSDGSGGDRPNFDLDGKSSTPKQNALIQAVIAKGKPMVVVLEGGSVINMPWLSTVPAVVMAWYPGQKGGQALADLLFGTKNFSGKLPVTWPAQYSDEPPLAGANQTTTMGYYVGYKYFDNQNIKPLFPFGFGLSYTNFAYSNLSVPCTAVNKDSVVNVQVTVKNTGTVPGDEVSMLFVSYSNANPPGAQHARPAKELKGFQRTTLMPGDMKVVTIPLRIQDLKYWNATTHSWQWDNGPVTIQVGGSLGNLPLMDSSITIMN